MTNNLFITRLNEISELIVLCKSDTQMQRALSHATRLVCQAIKDSKPILICGNGGSAADALHFSAELVGRFLQDRKPVNVICLNSNVAVLTAWSNDESFDTVFSRQVEAHGERDSVFIGISTSGRSKNVVNALNVAKRVGLRTVVLTGKVDSPLSEVADVSIKVPSTQTPRIQELHAMVYHFICEEAEQSIINSPC